MAQVLNIIIAIKERGFEAIDGVVDGLRRIKEELGKTDVRPIQEMSAELENMGQNVEKIADRIDESIEAVGAQAGRRIQGIFAGVGEIAAQGTETIFARVGAVALAAFAATQKPIINSIGRFFEVTQEGASLTAFFFKEMQGGAIAALESTLNFAATRFNFLLDRIALIGIEIGKIGFNLRGLTSLATVLGSSIAVIGSGFAGFLFFKTALAETHILIRRILGVGLTALSPLEHASRLVSTLDATVASTQRHFGQLVKIGGLFGFGFLAGINPLLTAIPALNIGITALGNLLSRSKARVSAFFGSPRAELELIFLDAKRLLGFALPAINRIAPILSDMVKSFGVARQQAVEMEKTIAKTGQQAHLLEPLTRMRLPLAAQAQIFFQEIKAFLSELLGSINRVSATLAHGFKIGEEGIAVISGRASAATNQAIGGIRAAGNEIQGALRRMPIGEKIRAWAGEFGGFFKRLAGGFAGIFTRPAGAAFRGGKAIAGAVAGEIQGFRQQRTATAIGPSPRIAQPLAQIPEVAAGAENALAALFLSIQRGATGFKEFRQALGEFLQILRSVAAGGASPAALAANIQSLFAALQALPGIDKTKIKALFEAFSPEKFKIPDIKQIEKLFSELQKILSPGREKKMARGGGMAMGEAFVADLRKAIESGAGKLPPAVTKLAQILAQFYKPAALVAQGENVPRAIAQGMESARGEIQRAANEIAQDIADTQPSSPPKKGPLRGILRSGAMIPGLLAQGMAQGIGAARNAAAGIAEVIANYFPRSLPGIGALRGLINAGLLIPRLLAQGIAGGASFAIGIVRDFVSQIEKAIERIAVGGGIAEKIGLSATQLSSLQFALAGTGAQVNDLELSFNHLNDVLVRELSIDELRKFDRLGIDLEAVRRAAQPNLELFMQLSDVVAQFGPASERGRMALEALGTTAHSNLVNVVRLGRGEISRLQAQGIELGTTFDDSLARGARALKAISERLVSVRDTIINDVLAVILPPAISAGNKILEIIAANRSRLSAFIQIAVEGLKLLFLAVADFLKFAWNEPDKAMGAIGKSLAALFGFLGNLLDQFLGLFRGKVIDFFREMAIFLLTVPKNIILNMFFEMTRIVVESIKGIFAQAIGPIIEGLKKIPFLPQDIMDQLDDVAEGYKATAKKIVLSGDGMGRAVRDSINQTIEETRALAEATQEAGQEMFAPERIGAELEKLTGSLRQMQTDFTSALQGTPLEEYSQRFSKIFELANFEQTLEKIDQIKEAAKGVVAQGEKRKESLREEEEVARRIAQDAEKRAAAGIQREITLAEMRARLFDEEQNRERVAQMGRAEREQFELEGAIARDNLMLLRLQERHAKEKEELVKAYASQAEIEQAAALQSEEKQIAANNRRIKAEKKAREEITADFLLGLAVAEQVANGLQSIVSGVYDLSGKKSRQMFFVQKGIAVAQALINVAQGVTKAIAEGGVLGIATGAAVGAAGAVQIAKIVAAAPGAAMQTGGTVRGPGGIDNVPARLTAGEFVQPVAAVNAYGPKVMEAIRLKLIPPDLLKSLAGNLPSPGRAPRTAFQAGGLALAQATSQPAAQPIFQNINIVDPNIVARYLSSQAGKRALINAIGDERREINAALQS